MDPETRRELRERTNVIEEDNNEAIYHIPKEYVKEFLTYGKPRDAIARILGKELAKQTWGLNEEEAVELRVITESRNAGDDWATKVSKQNN